MAWGDKPYLRKSTDRKAQISPRNWTNALATEQVLIFRAVLTFGGLIRRRQKSCKEGVCSIQCFPHTTRCCACFSDYVHTSRIQGYLYLRVCTFGALQPTANFSKNWSGTYLRGFTVYYKKQFACLSSSVLFIHSSGNKQGQSLSHLTPSSSSPTKMRTDGWIRRCRRRSGMSSQSLTFCLILRIGPETREQENFPMQGNLDQTVRKFTQLSVASAIENSAFWTFFVVFWRIIFLRDRTLLCTGC